MSGPYETEADTYDSPLVREVRALSPTVRSGDPDRIISGTQLKHLHAACTAAGVELGEFDRSILRWLAGYEASTVQVIIGLISRASDAGRDTI